MRPLFPIVAACLILAIQAHPENIEEIKQLPQENEPILEAEETEPQARTERCTTCSQQIQLTSPTDVLAAIKNLPGGVVHTQQSFEGCSSEKGCAGIKLKDGKVVEKFGNVDAFKNAVAKDSSKEFTFQSGFQKLIDGKLENPFWWMNQNSPFKNTGGFSKQSKSSSYTSATGGGVDLAANPFLNGDFAKLGSGFNAAGQPSTNFQSSAFESSSSYSSSGGLDVSGNPFLNGGVSLNQNAGQGFAGANGFAAQGASQNGFASGAQNGFAAGAQNGFAAGAQNGYAGAAQNGFAGGAQNGFAGAAQNGYASGSQNGLVAGSQNFAGAAQNGIAGAAQNGFASGAQNGFAGGAQNGFTSGSNGFASGSQSTSQNSFAAQNNFASNGFGYTGSSPRPFSASTAGSNINLIQNGQKTEFGSSQSVDEAFQSTGNVIVPEGSSGIQQTCSGQGYVCVPRAQCNNGVVNTNGGALLQANTQKQYCNVRTEICCRIETSSLGTTFQGSLGVDSATYNQGNLFSSQGSFGASGFESNSAFGSRGSSGYNGIGSTLAPPSFGSTQSNFIETDSFSAGSESGTYRPGAVGSGLKPGIPYLPPVDSTNSDSNIVTSTAFPTTFVTTPRPFSTPRPVTPVRPYLPPLPSTKAPEYLPPVVAEPSNDNPVYNDGSLILDETIPAKPTPRPFIPAPNEIPAGCAAALKCTPIEYCTAEGVISNTTVALTREQDAYRVPLTDCKHLESGRIGKCCRDPFYTDPWPANQLGRWVPDVFGGNDGKYIPDNRPSPNNVRNVVTPRPTTPYSSGSTLINTVRPAKPVTPSYNQVSPGFPATPGPIFGQGTEFGVGSYTKTGVGRIGIGGVGEVARGGQGGIGQTTQTQGFGNAGNQGFGQTTNFGQGSRGQIGVGSQTIVGQGQGKRVGGGAIYDQGVVQTVQENTVQGFNRGQTNTNGLGVVTQNGVGVNRGGGIGVIQNGVELNRGGGIGVVQNGGQTTQGFGTGQSQAGFGTRGFAGSGVTQSNQNVNRFAQGSFSQGSSQNQGAGFSAGGQATQNGFASGSGQSAGFGLTQNSARGASQGFGVSNRGQSASQSGFRGSQGGGSGSQGNNAFASSQNRGQSVSQSSYGGSQIGGGNFGSSQNTGQSNSQGGYGLSQGGQSVSQSRFGASQNTGQSNSQGGYGLSQGGQSASQGRFGSQSGSQFNQGGFGQGSQGFRQSAGQAFGQGGSQLNQAFGQGGGQYQGGFATQGQGFANRAQGLRQGYEQDIYSGVRYNSGQKLVSQRGGALVTSGGKNIIQNGGTGVKQGGGVEIENEYSASTQRVFLQKYSGGGQCGLLNPQRPLGNRNDLEVDFAEIPWQAMVLLKTNKSLLCGGVITRPEVVVTSAACVDGLDADSVQIKGGEWKLALDEEPLPFQIVQVKTILRHPEYRKGSLKNDVAILVLAENLRFAKNVQPICLPKVGETLDAYYNGAGQCIVTGWGKIVLQAHLSGSIMHSVNVSLINPGECEAKLSQDYPHLLEQYDQDSCVCGQPTNPLNNICKVDIGSALACTTGDSQYVLRGIYSWDSGCQIGNQIAAFYKFDVEWYEWAIGLIESVRFTKYTKVIQNKITTQVSNVKTIATGVKGGVGEFKRVNQFSVKNGGTNQGIIAAKNDGFSQGIFAVKGESNQGQFGFKKDGFIQNQFTSKGGINQEQSKNTGFSQSQIGANGFTQSQLGANGFTQSQLGANGFTQSQIGANGFTQNQFGAKGSGFVQGEFAANAGSKSQNFGFNQFGTKFSQVKTGDGVNFDQINGPITKTFSATFSEKKVFQSEPEIVTFTTKPEYFTYTTKPEIVTFTTKPEIVTFTTKPEIVTFTTKPEYFTYTTKPKLIRYTTQPKYITYEQSGSGNNPQYVAPGVSFNPSLSDIVKHKHDGTCKCLEGKK